MSKSFNNYVALTEPANDMYGKLMSIKDELILDYFTILTDIPTIEIEAMKQAMEQGSNPMEFKKQLALAITTDFHDVQTAAAAQQYFEKTVQAGDLPKDVPTVTLNSPTQTVLDILVVCQPKQSKGQLRRLCEQGAVKLMPQDEKLIDAVAKITVDNDQVIKIGKRNFYQLVIR